MLKLEVLSLKLHAVTHVVEQVCYTGNLNIISLFTFKKNSITCSLAHSKIAYFRTESKHPSMQPSRDVEEPCMGSPSSYEALLEVMDHF